MFGGSYFGQVAFGEQRLLDVEVEVEPVGPVIAIRHPRQPRLSIAAQAKALRARTRREIR